MTKRKKITLGVIGGVIVIVAVIVAIVLINKDDIILDNIPPTASFEGKIVEISSDDTVVVEVTDKRGSETSVGEKVIVNYTNFTAEYVKDEYTVPEDITDEFELQAGDMVTVQFWKNSLKKNGDSVEIDRTNGGVSMSVRLSNIETRTFG